MKKLPEIQEQDEENGGSSFYVQRCDKPAWDWDTR
jgi:hypothetical protein